MNIYLTRMNIHSANKHYPFILALHNNIKIIMSFFKGLFQAVGFINHNYEVGKYVDLIK